MTDFFAQDNSQIGDDLELSQTELLIGFGNCNGGGMDLIARNFNRVFNRIWRFLVPKGAILLWRGTIINGEIADIPDGWALCDGTQGTPDLGDKFVMGHGNLYTIDVTGGQAVRTSAASTTTPVDVAAGTDLQVDPSGHGHTLNILPPFHTLAYIMKL